MEEKQAELENPVESWNLSVKDVRKILSGKHRPSRRSASKDDVIREGDYPDDDEEEEEEEEVYVAEKTASVKPEEEREGGHQQEFIAEFPPRHEPSPPRRQTRSSTSKKLERSSASPVSSDVPVTAAKPSTDVPTDPRKKTTYSGGVQQRQTCPSVPVQPIPQPTALPPPHLKAPVTMVISRDPRVAKRQQQLLEKAQDTYQQQQQQTGQTGQTRLSGEGNEVESSKVSVNDKIPPESSRAEGTQQKSSEVDEARMRERLLLRQKYRIRKTSDRRDSREESSEERQLSPTATRPTPPPQQPIKSCLVKSPTTPSATTPSPTAADVKFQQQPNVLGKHGGWDTDDTGSVFFCCCCCCCCCCCFFST